MFLMCLRLIFTVMLVIGGSMVIFLTLIAIATNQLTF